MGNNKKQSQINWEDRLFQATLAFITSENIHEYNLSNGEILKAMRRAKTFIKEYKDTLNSKYFSDIIDE